MFEYTKILIKWKFDNLQVLVNFSLLWKGGGFVVKLVADKIIGQHMFYSFTLSYFLDDNLWNKKKIS